MTRKKKKTNETNDLSEKNEYIHSLKSFVNNFTFEQPILRPQEDTKEEPVLTPQEDVKEQPVLVPQENVKEEPVLVPQEDVKEQPVLVPQVKEQPVLTPQEDTKEEPVLTPNEDIKEEPVLTPQEDTKEEPVLTPNEDVKEEPVLTPQEDPIEKKINVLFTHVSEGNNIDINSWIVHHLNIGFSHIYILNIGNRLRQLAFPDELVSVINTNRNMSLEDVMKQSYNFSTKYEFDWMLYLRPNEYLNLSHNLNTFLNNKNYYDQVMISNRSILNIKSKNKPNSCSNYYFTFLDMSYSYINGDLKNFVITK